MCVFVCWGGDGCKVRDGENGWQENDREKPERERWKWQTCLRNENAQESDWQAETQTGSGGGGGIERQRPNLLRFQIKGERVQRLGRALSDLQIKLGGFGTEKACCEAKSALDNGRPHIKEQLDLGGLWADLQQSHTQTPENTLNNTEGADHLCQGPLVTDVLTFKPFTFKNAIHPKCDQKQSNKIYSFSIYIRVSMIALVYQHGPGTIPPLIIYQITAGLK